MKITAKQYAEALFKVTKDKSGAALTSAVKELVEVLGKRHELSRLREIVRAFDNAWRRHYGAATVTLTTAYEPSKKLLEELTKAYPKASIASAVDARLIGGAVIQVDDRLIDGSVSGQLERMKQSLSA